MAVDHFMLAFLILVVFLFSSRVIGQKAVKKLAAEKKAALIDLFSGRGLYIYGIAIILLLSFFACLHYHLIDPDLLLIIYMLSILIFIFITNYLSYKKLKDHDFPSDYIRAHILSTVIRVTGLVAFVVLLKF